MCVCAFACVHEWNAQLRVRLVHLFYDNAIAAGLRLIMLSATCGDDDAPFVAWTRGFANASVSGLRITMMIHGLSAPMIRTWDWLELVFAFLERNEIKWELRVRGSSGSQNGGSGVYDDWEPEVRLSRREEKCGVCYESASVTSYARGFLCHPTSADQKSDCGWYENLRMPEWPWNEYSLNFHREPQLHAAVVSCELRYLFFDSRQETYNWDKSGVSNWYRTHIMKYPV